MTNIQNHIDRNKDELGNPLISSQRRRHIESELSSLENYQLNHPGDDHDPTHLELFCNDHPDSPECKVYDL